MRSTAFDAGNRHFAARPGGQDLMRGDSAQGGQIGGNIAGLAAHHLIEHTAQQQEEDQHHRAVEISVFAVAQGSTTDIAKREAGCRVRSDIHIHGTRLEGPDGALEKTRPE